VDAAAPRILFAWEHGGGLGHVTRIAPIAHRLAALGARVTVAACDLAAAASLLSSDVRLHPCPLPGSARRSDAPQYNYAALLANAGWIDPSGLRGMLRAWDSLFEAAAPDVLVADFAPTALLASLGRGMARCALGNGFDLPPLASPLPAMSGWEPVDAAAMADAERAVLQAANAALGERGVPALARLADLFDCDWRCAATHAMFDVYPDRPEGDLEFVGPVDSGGIGGLRPDWPGAPGRRGFVYLRGEARFVDATVAALRALRASAIVFAPGLGEQQAADLATADVLVSTRPVDLSHAFEGADFVVTHSGTGLGALALARGLPVVLYPLYREQLMAAVRLSARGVARCEMPDRLDQALQALEAIVGQAQPRELARRLAGALPRRDDAVEIVARRLLEWAGRRSRAEIVA
jgi:predicted glycosyltransferase